MVPRLFDFIFGWVDVIADYDTPDGAFWAMHEDAVEAYNREFGTDHDWFDIQRDYIMWSNEEAMK